MGTMKDLIFTRHAVASVRTAAESLLFFYESDVKRALCRPC
jgi:hypothetical protein